MKDHNYFVYIVTNAKRTTLYVGMTNTLERRMLEHYFNKGNPNTFAGKYHCYNLVYYERHQYVWHAIEREKQIKGWTRAKKEMLIKEFNPKWKFLNAEIMEWPPVGKAEDYW